MISFILSVTVLIASTVIVEIDGQYYRPYPMAMENGFSPYHPARINHETLPISQAEFAQLVAESMATSNGPHHHHPPNTDRDYEGPEHAMRDREMHYSSHNHHNHHHHHHHPHHNHRHHHHSQSSSNYDHPHQQPPQQQHYQSESYHPHHHHHRDNSETAHYLPEDNGGYSANHRDHHNPHPHPHPHPHQHQHHQEQSSEVDGNGNGDDGSTQGYHRSPVYESSYHNDRDDEGDELDHQHQQNQQPISQQHEQSNDAGTYGGRPESESNHRIDDGNMDSGAVGYHHHHRHHHHEHQYDHPHHMHHRTSSPSSSSPTPNDQVTDDPEEESSIRSTDRHYMAAPSETASIVKLVHLPIAL